MYDAYSDWMKYEIDESKRMGMPILGIVPYGQERIPLYVQQNATEILRWNTASIVSAIRRYV